MKAVVDTAAGTMLPPRGTHGTVPSVGLLDDQTFRDLMAHVPAPVTVVTTRDDLPRGTTVSAFASLSLSPKLVMVSMDNCSRVLQRIRQVRRFGVNLLAEQQEDVAMRFARDEALRFAPGDWWLDNGLPRLDRTAAWIECDLAYELPAGDHSILVGEVRNAEIERSRPLVYSDRAFGTNSAALTTGRA